VESLKILKMEKIIVQARIAASKQKVWDYYITPKHIINWNFASEDWCCPLASNDIVVGGKYVARMEAKDGSFGFDFEAIYTEINLGENFTYIFGGRYSTVVFQENGNQTDIVITFDPETENSIELQKQGWQAILNNFKKYVESN
jgi:uncharacterized protein YndB with AHSA1/START domain